MKAIMLMFDSLNRSFLPAYGAQLQGLPNFQRLAKRAVTFDTCYGGSMPCMPARRELHTGRYNFLHRGWSPLEPFDDSVPEMLRDNGVYSHLVTDHQHYWEDGGATYHNRYSSYEFFRGQEGDAWKGHVGDPEIPESVSWREGKLWRQDWINRQYLTDVQNHSQTLTFNAGLEFIETNKREQNWFLQIECFDPHEPFFSYEAHKERFPHDYDGDHFDWPDYRPVIESDSEVAHARAEYAALLSMCDDSLGRLLDKMDEDNLWEDTLLMVCTDHGFMLGERGWWGKNLQPWFEENIHTPLFVWDPISQAVDERRDALVQMIDFGPTLLEFFGLSPTPDMQGRSLLSIIRDKQEQRKTGLFGIFGGHVCITDGRRVYMRACAKPENQPLEEFTLMPMRMDHRMSPHELKSAELTQPFSFTKETPVLKIAGFAFGSPFVWGTLLYDLETDPKQTQPLNDPELELHMATLLVEAMRANDAPASQFERLGLPVSGPVTAAHLLIDEQWVQVANSGQVDWRAHPVSSFGPIAAMSLNQIAAQAELLEQVERVLRIPLAGGLLGRFGHLTLWQLAVILPGISPQRLNELDAVDIK